MTKIIDVSSLKHGDVLVNFEALGIDATVLNVAPSTARFDEIAVDTTEGTTWFLTGTKLEVR